MSMWRHHVTSKLIRRCFKVCACWVCIWMSSSNWLDEEQGGAVVECELGVVSSRLTGVTVLCPWARLFILCLILLVQPKHPDMTGKLLTRLYLVWYNAPWMVGNNKINSAKWRGRDHTIRKNKRSKLCAETRCSGFVSPTWKINVHFYPCDLSNAQWVNNFFYVTGPHWWVLSCMPVSLIVYEGYCYSLCHCNRIGPQLLQT